MSSQGSLFAFRFRKILSFRLVYSENTPHLHACLQTCCLSVLSSNALSRSPLENYLRSFREESHYQSAPVLGTLLPNICKSFSTLFLLQTLLMQSQEDSQLIHS